MESCITKPTHDCTAPSQGDLKVKLRCDAPGDRNFCQVVFIHTMSWLPAGSAAVFLNGDSTPATVLDAYRQDWRENNKHYTIQVFTGLEDTSLQIPEGENYVRIRCTGESSAPEEYGEGATSRFLFQLHGIVVV